MSAGHLPEEVLVHMFNMLDPASCFRARRVCRAWRCNAAAGCVRIRVDFPKLHGRSLRLYGTVGTGPDHFDDQSKNAWKNFRHLHDIQLVGHRARIQQNPAGSAVGPAGATHSPSDAAAAAAAAGRPTPGLGRERWGPSRTKGHFPAPVALDPAEEQTTEPPMAKSVAKKSEMRGTAFRVELGGAVAGMALRSLELAASKFQSATYNFGPWTSRNWMAESERYGGEHAMYGVTGPYSLNFESTLRGPETLPKAVREADLAGLRWLLSLSVKGCTGLRELLVPPSLTALDASGAAKLRQLAFATGTTDGTGAGLSVLNLNGCRDLGRSPLLTALAPCRELDLCWCSSLPPDLIAQGLQMAGALVSASLRSVATTGGLLALAASPAAMAGRLELVDCAFSKGLADAGVDGLVRAAPRLQRVNLRGCTAVSARCYNQTPITLTLRNSDQHASSATNTTAFEHSGGGEEEDNDREDKGKDKGSGRAKARKGDNMFFFTS